MPGSPVLLLGMLHTWLTPFWLLSVGVALGVAVLAVVYGVLYLAWRPAADLIATSVREGILLPIFYVALFLTGFAMLGHVSGAGHSVSEHAGVGLAAVERRRRTTGSSPCLPRRRTTS